MKTIKVAEHFKRCIAVQDGVKLKEVVGDIEDGTTLDFEGITIVAPVFINAFLEACLVEMSIDELYQKLYIQNTYLTSAFNATLNNFYKYHTNPEYKASVDAAAKWFADNG